MWKYVTCCVKETLQRGVNYFDVRRGAGLASNPSTSVVPRKDNAVKSYQEKFRCSGNADEKDTRRNDSGWYHYHVSNPWINAFSWSGAVVLGWYASQLLCCNRKRRQSFANDRRNRYCNLLLSNTKALHSALLSCAFAQPPQTHRNDTPLLVVNSNFFNESSTTNVPYNVVNQNDSTKEEFVKKDDEVMLSDAIKDLTNVLSSVENKLGLAAIEGGDLREGLSMLHSAAQRNHAPALYNLAICYEKGLGMKPNEKMAAELYRVAASLDHPAATYNLAVFHGQGRGGLARDPLAAERFLRLAAARGQKDAIRILQVRQYQKRPPSNPQILTDSFSPEEKFPTEVFLDFITGNNLPKNHQQKVLLY